MAFQAVLKESWVSDLSVDCVVASGGCLAYGYYMLKDGVHSGGLEVKSPCQLQITGDPVLHLFHSPPTLSASTRSGHLLSIHLPTQKQTQSKLSESPLLYHSQH
jgi:hypothetical protein